MKKSKWLALAGVSLLSVGVLVACSSKSNTSSNTYNYVYTADLLLPRIGLFQLMV